MTGMNFGDEVEEEGEKKKNWCRNYNKKVVFLCAMLLVIFIVWAVIRPTKPRFELLEATVFALNVSETNLLTSKFQVTVRSSNPNGHVGIYYDRLLVYASFNDQQITLSAHIPPTYQDKNEVNIWSAFVFGVSIPIATFTGASLKQDQTTWNLPILFKIDGSVRWKVEAFTTKTYHIRVYCHAYIHVGNPTAGVAINNNIVKYQLYKDCTVSV